MVHYGHGAKLFIGDNPKPVAVYCAKCGAFHWGQNHLCYMPIGVAYQVDELGRVEIINGKQISQQSHDLFIASQAELYGWDEK